MSKITSTTVRMYRMGTGDCFVLKFFSEEKEKFTMMIDCGTWSGSKKDLTPFIQDLKSNLTDHHLDLLVITHEHKDHVHGFDVCEELFTNDFTVDKIWMGWTENDKNPKVKKWKKEFGDKKKALALASKKLNEIVTDENYEKNYKNEFNGLDVLKFQKQFAANVNDFNELQNGLKEGDYVGGLAGMKVVKEDIAKNNIDYLGPGDIIEKIPKLDGIKFFVLGPPKVWEGEVNIQHGEKGETYEHNKKLLEDQAFSEAVLNISDKTNDDIAPFDEHYMVNDSTTKTIYNKIDNTWRKIDYDWLNSSGNLALRINSITNNLSLVLAIEFEDSGKIMLFPGDAEYGSWLSWHKIPWSAPCRNGKPHLTEDMLSRTVFFKVAHHLSHNGTAERLGMDMMTHPDLVSMATLDYDIISPTWKGTMPNRALLKSLVSKTKGRLIVMNNEGLIYDKTNNILLKDKIQSERKKMSPKELEDFNSAFSEEEHYFEFRVNGK